MEDQKDLDWMDNVKAPVEVEATKGVVQEIREPRIVETKDYGKRKIIELTVACPEGSVIVSEFLPSQFPILTPSSNLGKVLKKYKCKSLRNLIGMEVEVVKGKQDAMRLKKD